MWGWEEGKCDSRGSYMAVVFGVCAQQHKKDLQMLAFWLANTAQLSINLRKHTKNNEVRVWSPLVPYLP